MLLGPISGAFYISYIGQVAHLIGRVPYPLFIHSRNTERIFGASKMHSSFENAISTDFEVSFAETNKV